MERALCLIGMLPDEMLMTAFGHISDARSSKLVCKKWFKLLRELEYNRFLRCVLSAPLGKSTPTYTLSKRSYRTCGVVIDTYSMSLRKKPAFNNSRDLTCLRFLYVKSKAQLGPRIVATMAFKIPGLHIKFKTDRYLCPEFNKPKRLLSFLTNQSVI